MDCILPPHKKSQGRYRVGYFEKARDEGHKALSEEQYAYVVRVVGRLRLWNTNPNLIADLRIESVDCFYELKLKGNVLGKTNLRIFFSVFDQSKTIVVLGPYKKEDEGALPRQVILKMRNRHRVAETLIASVTATES